MYFKYLIILPTLLSLAAGLPTPAISADNNVRSSLSGRDNASASSSNDGASCSVTDANGNVVQGTPVITHHNGGTQSSCTVNSDGGSSSSSSSSSSTSDNSGGDDIPDFRSIFPEGFP